MNRFSRNLLGIIFLAVVYPLEAQTPRTTGGYVDTARTEPPGTLLSHPIHNGSEQLGRTVTLNYLNGWLIAGQEGVGSRPGSDLEMRVFDVADPKNPVRLRPSDFGHNYPPNPARAEGGSSDSWMNTNGETDSGWASHGTARFGNYMFPDVMRVQSFGGVVERGVWYLPNGVPRRENFPIGDNRSSQAGPWFATYSTGYNPFQGVFEIGKYSMTNGGVGVGTRQFTRHATFDHTGAFGMGGWAPMFFGDLLIYAREVNDVDIFTGFAARDGVVVYRIPYSRLDNADPAQRTLEPQLVGTLPGGFNGYWPVLFSDGSGLYVIGADTDTLMGVDITRAADPAGDGTVSLAASSVVPGLSNSLYPVFQDNHGFIHNRKIDMTRFLAGDPDPITLTLNMTTPLVPAGSAPAPSGVDTSQMALIMGNLWVTGGYPHYYNTANYKAQGMAIWVHQQAPDTAKPRVAFHIPQANRMNYPRHAPLSFILHEHSRAGAPINGTDFLVRPVLAGGGLGTAVAGFLIHDFSGVLTFTPDEPLQAGTTYQVDFVANEQTGVGFRDVAGNFIEPYSFRFSTGSAINANPLPVLDVPVADNHTIAPGGNVTVSASATGAGPMQYRFNFGAGWGEWGSAASATHTFTAVGRPRVMVQARDANGGIATQVLTLLVMNAPQGPFPTASSTMAAGEDGQGRRVVWSVNPDANTVAVVDALSGNKTAEHATGKNPRTVARDGLGRYWVACHGSDDIWVLNGNGTLHHRIALRYGAAPYAVAASPDGTAMYATLYGSGRLLKFSTANPSAAPVERQTFETPRAIAISGNGARVFVTRFISPDLHGEVGEFRSSDLALQRTIRLAEALTPDASDRAAGVPNYLSGIAISPDGKRAAVVSKQDNARRGQAFGLADMSHETMVRAVISFLDLETTNAEIPNSRRDFDNSESPSAVAFTPMGDRILVALQGNNRIVALDNFQVVPLDEQILSGSTWTSPAVTSVSLETGLAPQGVLLDTVTRRLFSQDFMGRTVTVYDAEPLLLRNRTALPLLARTSTVDNELLPGNILLGKRIFYNAADPRMGADSYISCASCHVDGGHDGRSWDFTGRGEGLRRTTDLRGRSGTGHGNVHWSGNFDEIQDFEHDMRGPFGGTGFLPLTPEQFQKFHPSPASGKSGLSEDLDALAAYVESLGPESVPKSPHRTESGSFTVAANSGRSQFESLGCTDCHGGDKLTESAVSGISSSVLRPGTLISSLSGFRLGGALAGIDTPSLHGLHATRLYLHHGLAAGLSDVFSFAGGKFLNAGDAIPLPASNSTVAVSSDNPIDGGGGHMRGAFGGKSMALDSAVGATPPPGVRFTGVDGGSGGTARIGVRYSRKWNDGTAILRVNGVEQSFPVLRQEPNFSWMSAGWRWAFLDVNLNSGATNTVEVLQSGTGDINGILVSNSNDLAGFERHSRVAQLPQAQRDELFAYLRQVDGRNSTGTPLQWGPATNTAQPTVVQGPVGGEIAQGNSYKFHAIVAGRGPFSFQWMKNGTDIAGATSQEFSLSGALASQTGNYSVRVTSAAGSTVSSPAFLQVNPPLTVVDSPLPEGRVRSAFSHSFVYTGGTGNRTWSLAGGVLPPGMELLANGTLRGTPTAPAREELTVQVADSLGTAQRTFLLEVAPVGGFSTDPDLILHYTFDEGTGGRVWDIARAGNNHSTTVSGPYWSTAGRFAGSYGPGGTNQLVKGFSPANQGDLNFDPRSDQFTISAWVRTNNQTGWRAVFSKDVPNVNAQYRLWTPGNTTSLQIHSAGGHQNGNLPAGTDLRGEEWHLLTYVNSLQSGVMRTRIYRNGQLIAERQPGTQAPVSGLMKVGDSSQTGNEWGGWIDDFRVYRRALAVSEIQALYDPVPSSVTLGNLTQTYARTPRSISVSTNPPDLQVSVTYNGSATAPTNAGNYTVNATITEPGYSGTATATLSIAPKGLTISGLSGVNKVFDGTAAANVTGTATLTGAEPGDTVTLGGAPSFAFNNSTVGTNKPITASGYTISGSSASNYSLAQPEGLTGNISASTATIVIGNLAQIYNRTAHSVLITTSPAGLSVSVTYNGSATAPTNAGNYTVNATITEPGYSGTATATLSIAPKGLTISGLSGVNKVFDGTAAANVTGTATLNGVEPGDTVTLGGAPSFAFNNSAVGTNKPITASGYTISGSSASNYSLAQPVGLTANISSSLVSANSTALQSLTVSAGSLTPPFSSATRNYTVAVAHETDSLAASWTTLNPSAVAQVRLNSGTFSTTPGGTNSGNFALAVGNNTVTIRVTAQDGVAIGNHTIKVTRARSADTALSSLTLGAGVFSPAFSTATSNYSLSVVNKISSTTVNATKATAGGKIEARIGSGKFVALKSGSASSALALASGSNVLEVKVTADNGVDTVSYFFTITRAASGTLLSNLVSRWNTTNLTMSPAFSSNNSSYSLTVANSVSSITVLPTLAETNSSASARVGSGNFTAIATGKASSALALTPGSNSVEVRVLSDDKVTSRIYSLAISRLPAPMTNPAGAVSLNGTTLSGTMDARSSTAAFQIGTSPSFGISLPVSFVGGNGTASVSTGTGALQASMLYYFRLTSQYGGITDYGTTGTFLTPARIELAPVAMAGGNATDIAPGATFVLFGNPAINLNRDTAFHATTKFTGSNATNNAGIWKSVNGTATLVARIGANAIGGGVFSALGEPVLNSNNRLAFIGTLKVGVGNVTKTTSTGIWQVAANGTTALVAKAGSEPPGAAGTIFSSFSNLVVGDGGVAFRATLASGSANVTTSNNSGIWAQNASGNLVLVARLGASPTPTLTSLTAFNPEAGQTGHSRHFNSDGDLLLFAKFGTGQLGVYKVNAFAFTWNGTTPLAAVGSPVPGITAGVFSTISNPILSESDEVAFKATFTGNGVTSGNNTGIFVYGADGAGQLMVRTGVAQSDGRIFQTISSPILNGAGNLAFTGALKTGVGGVASANATGVWTISPEGELATIARVGDEAPGLSGARFASFSQIAYPDEAGIAFTATLATGAGGVTTSNNFGFWAASEPGSSPSLIIRTGDSFAVGGVTKTISKFSVYSASTATAGACRSFNALGDVIFLLTFTDGTSGLFKYELP